MGERRGEVGGLLGGGLTGQGIGDGGSPLGAADPPQQQRKVTLGGERDVPGGAGGEAGGMLEAGHLGQVVEADDAVQVAQ